MAFLDSFPNEIFIEILSFLSYQDVASTCRVSRHFQAISEPLLYHTGLLVSEPGLYPPTHESDVHIFLRTLLTPGREQLTNYVHTLAWYHEGLESAHPLDDLVTAAASRLGLNLPLGSEGAHMVILLHILPRLQILSLSASDGHGVFQNFMDGLHTLQPNTALPLGLQTVREVRWYKGSFVSPKSLLTLFSLPSIHTLDVMLQGDIDSDVLFPEAAATAAVGSSAVTRLKIRYDDTLPSSVAHILGIPRGLKHFSYCGTENIDLDIKAFGIALEPVKGSLEKLRLRFGHNFYGSGSHPATDTICSLREWPVLETVSCALSPLLGKGPQHECPRSLADVLPAGIRELKVLYDRHWSVAEVVQVVVVLLGQKQAMVPRLRKVTVLRDQMKSVEMMETLKAACEAANVELMKDRWSGPNIRRNTMYAGY